MSIKVRTRKILWSRSGNRCAICKKLLVHKIDVANADFIVGEECHIVSSKKNGPRGEIEILNDFDDYKNLILLCANDHKLIDDFPETFSLDILIELKNNHENWVEKAIEKDLLEYIQSTNNIQVLDEVKGQTELRSIIPNSHIYFFDFSTIKDRNLSIRVSEFFEDLRDLIDIYSEIEISQLQRYLLNCEDEIKEFNKEGIRIFGKGLVRKYKFQNVPESDYKVAMFIAFDPKESPQSVENNKLTVKLPDDFNPLM
ncbi:HNH endonuclease signature motif containing protein [Flavobacterium sp. FlaQc-57]|uniref:HNH endonuclease signature motif containing protein n=1 Tax=Flavobacterium sp. FlaQc-57 TaxID=3374186 RepID=UPI003756981F